MTLQRLLQMGPRELAVRSRQAIARRWDRAFGPRTMPAPAGLRLDDFVRAAGGRFFAGATSEVTPALVTAALLAHRDDTVAGAEAILRRRFDLLGYRGLDFGTPIDWHLDPVTGRRAPGVHWSRIDPLDAAAVGDSKVIWELNRLQWLVRLALAYRLTGEERYARALAGDVHAWLAANPRGIGINWASSLEAALRIIAWCWMLVLLRGARPLTSALFGAVAGAVRAHALHVETHLSHYFAPNTHLTGEALALFYAGTLFAELPGARRWRATGTRILLEQLDRQVRPDGVHVEQAACYQRYTVEIYLHFVLLAARNGITLPASVAARLELMLDVLLHLRRPDGSMPAIGDADGGWLLPLATRAPDDLRGVFSTAAALFGRADYAWAAGGLAPEAVWLFGAAAPAALERLQPAPPAAPPSRAFRDGGLVVMASGWSDEAHQLVLDAGPLGCPRNAGHGHADLLSVQVSVFGRPCLVDAGTYNYTAEPGWRDYFRSTAAHSTVVVDGQSQAVPAGPFKWRARPAALLERWRSSERLDFADASHGAYRRLADPVTHRRRVLFVKPGCWVLIDDLSGTAEHTVDVRFQFAPLPVAIDAHGWTRAYTDGAAGLLLRAFAPVPLKATLHEGELEPRQGWIAPDYGRRVPAPAVVYSTVSRLPLRVVTLVLPSRDVDAARPDVSSLVEALAADLGDLHVTRA